MAFLTNISQFQGNDTQDVVEIFRGQCPLAKTSIYSGFCTGEYNELECYHLSPNGDEKGIQDPCLNECPMPQRSLNYNVTGQLIPAGDWDACSPGKLG